MISIKINGLERIDRMMARLPKKLDQEVLRKSREFMNFVLKYARAKAPKSTGNLANSLKVIQRGKSIILTTDAYYAKFVEFGFAPHVIPVQYMEQHYSSPGMPGQFVPKKQTSGFVHLSGAPQPFLYPAFEDALSQLPNMLRNAAKNAIQESK